MVGALVEDEYRAAAACRAVGLDHLAVVVHGLELEVGFLVCVFEVALRDHLVVGVDNLQMSLLGIEGEGREGLGIGGYPFRSGEFLRHCSAILLFAGHRQGT